jgi:hypothetical protein
MSVKKILTAEEFALLDAATKALYTEENDGSYLLDLEGGFDDVSALKRAKDHEKSERQKAEARALESEARAVAAETKQAGTLTEKEKQWKDAHAREQAKLQATIDGLRKYVEKTHVDDTAQAIAAEISTSPKAMALLIQKRLKVDYREDGTPELHVLDELGNVSGMTKDDLKKALRADPELRTILVGSKAGGGANGQTSHGGASGKKWSEMSFEERKTLAQADPSAYAQIAPSSTPRYSPPSRVR